MKFRNGGQAVIEEPPKFLQPCAMTAARTWLLSDRALGPLTFAIALGAYGPSVACEPVWVREVVPSSYASAFVGKVSRVEWIGSKVAIVPIKRIAGSVPHAAELQFTRWPWECGHQTFHVGEIVDVFLDRPGVGWAQSPDQIKFGPSEMRALGAQK